MSTTFTFTFEEFHANIRTTMRYFVAALNDNDLRTASYFLGRIETLYLLFPMGATNRMTPGERQSYNDMVGMVLHLQHRWTQVSEGLEVTA
jgi:hypothetical protein